MCARPIGAAASGEGRRATGSGFGRCWSSEVVTPTPRGSLDDTGVLTADGCDVVLAGAAATWVPPGGGCRRGEVVPSGSYPPDPIRCREDDAMMERRRGSARWPTKSAFRSSST